MVPRLWKAALVGLVAGAVVFFVIQPATIEQSGSPFLEHGSQLGLLFFVFPVIVLPLVCILATFFFPKTRIQAFKLAMVIASAVLVPIPVFGYWIARPHTRSFGAFSEETLLQVGFSFVEVMILGLIASFIASLISPPLSRVVSRLLSREES